MQHLIAIFALVMSLSSCKTPEASQPNVADEPIAAATPKNDGALPKCVAKILIKCPADHVDACNVEGAKPTDRHRCVPESFCFDGERVRVRCEPGMQLTHTGCPGGAKMLRCGGCNQLAAVMCQPNYVPTVVPECKKPGYGDCVPQ